MGRFAIIGLGRFGKRLAMLLSDAGADVIAIDRQKELVETVRDRVALAVCLDSTNADALRAQGIDRVDVAVVGIGAAFEENALTTAILKQLGVRRVISRATTSIRGQILMRIGADDIVNPEREAAERWSSRLISPKIMERIELAAGYSLSQVAAPASFHNKTLEDLAIRKKHNVNVVAIRRDVEQIDADGKKTTSQQIISVPMPDSVIAPGDVLLLIGSDQAIEAIAAR